MKDYFSLSASGGGEIEGPEEGEEENAAPATGRVSESLGDELFSGSRRSF